MQYKVPQNVDIEDRVIGTLTLRQFMILLIGAGFILIFNFIFVGPLRIIFWFLALLIGGVALAFAFVKYGDQRLEIFAMSAFKTITAPRKRIWKKEEVLPQIIKKATEPKPESRTAPKKNLEEAKGDLEKLAELVDSGGYSQIEQKDRTILPETPKVEDHDTPDFIAETEKPNPEIDAMINSAKTEKKEPLVSEMAKVSPTKDFDYPKIELADDGFLEELKSPRE